MNKRLSVLVFCIVAIGFGCASQQKHFEDIVPGMSTGDVRKAMKDGPTRFENIANTNFAAWYWKDEFCVLFQENKVVGKDSRQEGRNVKLGPGQYEEARLPQCLAPGQTALNSTERTVNIPGIGKVTLPKSLPIPKREDEPQHLRPRNPAGTGQ